MTLLETCVFMFALCLALLLSNTADPLTCDVLVVCPQACDQAIAPWVEYRESQGHRICLLRPTDRKTIKSTIVRLATEGQLRYVVLIGDAPDRRQPDELPLGRVESPTCYVEAKVNVKFGSEPWIASDNPYADIDDDGIPDLCVGRIAVDTPEEVTAVLQKVMAYEQEAQHSNWRRKINLVAGVGGFGALADSVLEMSTKRFIVECIPPGYEASMTYGSWQSPYCPSPPQFRAQTIGRLNDGCLMWVYIGHGMPGYVAPVQTPLKYYPVLDVRDMGQLEASAGAPIAVFLACYTAAFDLNLPGDCMAEEMLTQPKGPVAILGASRISMPYAMAVLSNAMLREYFLNQQPTLGEMINKAKRATMENTEDSTDSNRSLLDALAASFSPTRNLLEQERLENLALFNLIGDPLLRLKYPDALMLEVPDRLPRGQAFTVRGTAPYAGKLSIEIAYRRDRLLKTYPKRTEYTGQPEQLIEFERTYAEANKRIVTAQRV